MREELEARLIEAVERVVRELSPDGPAPDLSGITLVPARGPGHGDYACNAALILAKPLGQPPRAIAERIAAALDAPEVERVEIAGPGFLNLYLAQERWRDVISRVLREGPAWGRSDSGAGQTVQVEFVSANPTGPLTIGHGRNAVLGDAVARLLEAIGHKVTREYYFNDGGRQMRVLAESLRARYEQVLGRDAQLPEEGYQGEYLVAVARALVEEHGSDWLEEEDDAFKRRAQQAIFAEIEVTLERLAIRFDVFFNEATLYENGSLDEALETLRERGLVYEQDGATWFRSTQLGLDRDRVLVRSTGEPTYLLPDVAYHREKLSRGFQCIIDVLGPDHIEQFPYVKAATTELGCDTSGLEVVLYQWVNLRSGGEVMKMSTRKAAFVTIDEVLDEVGADVFRFFMIERRADTHFDFDLDLARERSDRNPVYKIQYAHARLCSIERKGGEMGVQIGVDAPLGRLDSPAELDLLKRLGGFPECVAHAANAREPQEIARFLLDLASAFHTYVSDAKRHRVLSDDSGLSRARLALVAAVRTTLANGLGLLGISAPERM